MNKRDEARAIYAAIMDIGTLGLISPDDVKNMVMQGAEIDDDFFAVVSERSIEIGAVEKLDEAGYRAAIERLGYELALETVRLHTLETSLHEELESPEFNGRTDQYDQIINTTALAAGVPFRFVVRDVAASIDRYVNAMLMSSLIHS